MGPVPASQFRPPLSDTNPNIRKDNAAEKRKRAVPKRFRPAAPKPTIACLPLPEAPPKSTNDVPGSQPPLSVPVPVCKSTPWPGTGKMSSNLFKDRNWLLLPNYLDNGNEHKTENEPKIAASVTSPRPPIKEEEEPKMTKLQKNVSGDQIAHFVNPRRRKRKRTRHNSKRHHPNQNYNNHKLEDQRL